MKKTKLMVPLLSTSSLAIGMLPMLSLGSCSKVSTLEVVGEDELTVGQTTQLQAKLKGQKGEIFLSNVEWSVDTSLGGDAHISEKGELTAMAPGEVTVIIYSKDNSFNVGQKVITIKSYGTKIVPEEFLDIKDGILRGFNVDEQALAFYDTLVIPNSVKSIQKYAFYDFKNDKSTIPANIALLKFAPNENFEGYIAPSKTSSIEEYAFYKAPFFRVVLPVGVRRIEKFAFSHSNIEYCNFPVYLNYIGEQAFSYSKIRSVAFDATTSDGSYEQGQANVPWAAQLGKEFSLETVVQYVGEKAFFNCKNLVYHKPTFYKDAYQLSGSEDEWSVERSPFATLDENSGKTLGSNLKILDYSLWYQNSFSGFGDIPKDPISTFGISIDVSGEPSLYEDDKYMIIPNQHYLQGRTQQHSDILRQITDSFKLSQITTFDPYPTRFGSWKLATSWGFNYTHAELDPSYYQSFQALFNPFETILVDYEYDKTYSFEVPIHQLHWGDERYLLGDTICFVDNITSDIDSPIDFSNEVVVSNTIKIYDNRVNVAVSLQGFKEIKEQSAPHYFTLTLVSPSTGLQYTYGSHYYIYGSGDEAKLTQTIPNFFNLIY